MKTDELREKYLAFFETKGHSRQPSDVLVPTWDPSVLFTPAGMNQFKPHFLGKIKLEFTRATTCQKCLRTGDIDNVGRTAYHHTFFEMLGNFSFGDYFKREAIQWAWEFLTEKQWLGLDPERLTVTVYKDDTEAAKIWSDEIGLPSQKIEPMDEADNFWPASAPSEGPDGVCGPCSEIFYHDDDGKSVEIWNLVFTQFNRVGDPPDNLRPLPSKNIDTGMGLERTASVLQKQVTNYHIDILRPIVDAAAEVCEVKYDPSSENGRRLRRITDHIRACAFAIHENVYPGANKEKYVIRRLLRRAVLDGHQMGRREPFLHALVGTVAEQMKNSYPELTETTERVASVIRQEEKAFLDRIDGGLQRIERIFSTLEDESRTLVHGSEAADLYQTYGVPPELFESLAADNGYTFDWPGFKEAMEQHGKTSGTLADTVMNSSGPIDSLKKSLKESKFDGYDATETEAVIKGIVYQDQLVESIASIDEGATLTLVLDRTPFYGESGGQVGDTGSISSSTGQLTITDTQKDGGLFLHLGTELTGQLSVGQKVTAKVDGERRDAICRAHSATHILHYALQKNLGKHAQQQGSKVTDDWLRFDFTNLEPVEADRVSQITTDVLDQISADKSIRWDTVPLDEARASGAMMLFGEKYPDPVRMVSMGEFSKELCGGTHLPRTGLVGDFEIISEEGVSAGTRRIVALTGAKATEHIRQCETALKAAAKTLGIRTGGVTEAADRLVQEVRDLKKAVSGSGAAPATAANKPSTDVTGTQLRKQLQETARNLNVGIFEVPGRVSALVQERDQLREQLSRQAEQGVPSASDLIGKGSVVGDVRLVVSEVPAANGNLLRSLIDQIRQSSAPCAVLLATIEGNSKVTLVAGVSRDIQDRMHAGNWVKAVAPVVGGGGGGKPDMAQAGGKQPAKLQDALEEAKRLANTELGKA